MSENEDLDDPDDWVRRMTGCREDPSEKPYEHSELNHYLLSKYFKNDAFENILKEGYDPNKRDHMGQSLLYHAYSYDQFKIALKYGANPRFFDDCYTSPLHHLADRCDTEFFNFTKESIRDIVTLLLESGTPITSCNHRNQTIEAYAKMCVRNIVKRKCWKNNALVDCDCGRCQSLDLLHHFLMALRNYHSKSMSFFQMMSKTPSFKRYRPKINKKQRK